MSIRGRMGINLQLPKLNLEKSIVGWDLSSQRTTYRRTVKFVRRICFLLEEETFKIKRLEKLWRKKIKAGITENPGL